MASRDPHVIPLNNLCNVQDFEDSALRLLPKKIKGYYASGACGEVTLANNKSAFQKLRIRPRVMKDVSVRNLEIKVLDNQRISFPIGIAPAAMQKMAHHEGEIGACAAAGEMGTVYILSTLSTTSIEDLAAACPKTIKWLQLYIYKDRNLTREIVTRADKAGFKALVLTVDTPKFGIRYADTKNQFEIPAHLTLANFTGKESSFSQTENGSSSLSEYVNHLFDPTLSWKDVEFLKSITKLPIVLKGILTKEDAQQAVDLRVAGILVSNHGARQLDTVPATIEALPEIAEVVNGKVDVYLDGGVRYGTDVFKALALGAKMVFVARPALWGLTNGGKKGVKKVLEILKTELDNALALSGVTDVNNIKKELVTHESYYAKL